MNPIDLLNSRVEHVYWGSEVGPEDAILTELPRWGRLVRIERMDDVISSTAKMLAGDAVVGWVQGPCEYGPSALGNRIILADPRPAANKDRINQKIKKRRRLPALRAACARGRIALVLLRRVTIEKIIGKRQFQ